jgi:hypothetical protein
MASSGYTRVIRVNTLTRKIPNGRILKWTIVVGIPRKYISIVY